MSITYQREWFIHVMKELPPLFLAHYDEIALDKKHMQLNPHWEQFVNLEANKILHVLTARTAENKLVGYSFNLVYPHLHYCNVLCSFTDMFFLDKSVRSGWEYLRMYRANEKLLRGLGVKKIFVMTKAHKDFRPVMKRLKYKFIERIFSKWIGD